MTSTLPGSVLRAQPGMIGCDTDTVINAGIASALYRTGFRFAIRYLSRTGPQRTGDLSTAEATKILTGGLARMAVQQ